MNKALVLTLALLAGGSVIWLTTRRGSDADPATGTRTPTTAEGEARSAAEGLQAPPADAPSGSRAAPRPNAPDAAVRAAPIAVAEQPAAPPQIITLAPVSATAGSEGVSDRNAVFAERYAKLDSVARMAKLEELVRLLDDHTAGRLVNEHKLDDDRAAEVQAEIDWLASNPGN